MSTEQECCGCEASCSPALPGPFVCVCVCVRVCVSVQRAQRQRWTQGSEQSSGPSLFEAVSEAAASERARPEVTMTTLRCSSSPTQPFPWVPSMCWIAWRQRTSDVNDDSTLWCSDTDSQSTQKRFPSRLPSYLNNGVQVMSRCGRCVDDRRLAHGYHGDMMGWGRLDRCGDDYRGMVCRCTGGSWGQHLVEKKELFQNSLTTTLWSHVVMIK